MAKLSTRADLERWKAFLDAQALPLTVTAEPWKAPRRLEANAYLWSAIYKPLVEVAGFTSDDWHRHYCGEFFGWKEVILPSGHIDYRPIRTTTTDADGKRDVMKGKPFNEFLSFVESDVAKRGVFVQQGRAV